MLSSRLVRIPIFRKSFISNLYLKNTNFRAISTSKKNSDSTATATATHDVASETKKEEGAFWQHQGFGITEKEDNFHMHLTFFFGITVAIMMTSFYIAYAPSSEDWEQREAFLELRRREKLGLPIIDPNYYDPSTIVLPSDEELGDTEVFV